MKKSKISYSILLLMILLVLGATRLPGLMHGSSLHPDERVFLNAAEGLSRFLLGLSSGYTAPKFYPEGGFVLHTPMQLLRMAFHLNIDPTAAGRLTGLILFLAGVSMGLKVLRRFFTKDISATVVYLLTMAFGLIHVEQSRYATGDTGSFLFLMCLVYWSFLGMETGKLRFFLLACIAGGFLTADKYPLVFFLLIPYLGFRKTYGGSPRKQLSRDTWKAAGCFLLGFLLLSPKTLTSPAYLFWTAAHETHNYMAGTNITEVGGPHNHLIAVTVYTLLYSGIPLLPGAVAKQWLSGIRAFREKNGSELLRDSIIPAVCVGFFLYNLFVTAVFLRTYYPFFCLLDLYCAALAAKWLKGHKGKAVLVLLCTVMCLRGGLLLGILGTDDGVASMKRFMEDVPREKYTFITELKPGYMAFPDTELPMRVIATDLKDDRFYADMHLLPGELLISTYQEYGTCTKYPLPIFNRNVKEYISLWQDFKEANSAYYLGQLYPDWYYSLFGFWVKGSTGMPFEFPANQFYLNPIS